MRLYVLMWRGETYGFIPIGNIDLYFIHNIFPSGHGGINPQNIIMRIEPQRDIIKKLPGIAGTWSSCRGRGVCRWVCEVKGGRAGGAMEAC